MPPLIVTNLEVGRETAVLAPSSKANLSNLHMIEGPGDPVTFQLFLEKDLHVLLLI